MLGMEENDRETLPESSFRVPTRLEFRLGADRDSASHRHPASPKLPINVLSSLAVPKRGPESPIATHQGIDGSGRFRITNPVLLHGPRAAIQPPNF